MHWACKTNLQNLHTFICIKDASRRIQYGFGIRSEVEHWEPGSEFLIGLNEFEWCSMPRHYFAVICETGRVTPFNIHHTTLSKYREKYHLNFFAEIRHHHFLQCVYNLYQNLFFALHSKRKLYERKRRVLILTLHKNLFLLIRNFLHTWIVLYQTLFPDPSRTGCILASSGRSDLVHKSYVWSSILRMNFLCRDPN